MTSGDGNDILIGDGGEVSFEATGSPRRIVSVDVYIGGNDILEGGGGRDILIGGQGSDLMYGNFDEDLMFGGNAAILMSGGIVQSIESDAQDFLTSALFKSFKALPGEDGDEEEESEALLFERVPGSMVVLPSWLSDIPQAVQFVLR